MSKRKVKNKIYALIIVVTLFASVNNLSQAEEKSTVAGMMQVEYLLSRNWTTKGFQILRADILLKKWK